MKEFTYTITDSQGIHARPAGILVKEANKFSAAVKISKGGNFVDAKRIFSIMSLAAKKGETVTVTFDGEDEETVFEALKTFFENNL